MKTIKTRKTKQQREAIRLNLQKNVYRKKEQCQILNTLNFKQICIDIAFDIKKTCQWFVRFND